MFYPVGDSAVCLEYADSSVAQGQIQEAVQRLKAHPIPYVKEWVPGLTTITFFYMPHKIGYHEICKSIEEALAQEGALKQTGIKRTIHIPICYGGEYGPDLEAVADLHDLSPSDVIDLHSSSPYTVRLLGFIPGFPYLEGTPNRIVAPRRSTPRVRVPQGSVGIAGGLTGIYPFEISGGWQIIGRTPLEMFSVHREFPFLVQLGDEVFFQPIHEEEFIAWRDGDVVPR